MKNISYLGAVAATSVVNLAFSAVDQFEVSFFFFFTPPFSDSFAHEAVFGVSLIQTAVSPLCFLVSVWTYGVLLADL